MPALTQSYPRLWSIEAGVAMVVTDLHGDWDAYQRYRDRFVDLQAGGRADWLIFTGDLIHAEEPEYDHSLEIVLDVMALQAHYGQAVIYLCGNHEMPHLYSISLAKGQKIYTPSFEKALAESEHRAAVIVLFDSLPFYIRTRAGVSLTHAGAASVMADDLNPPKLFNWSHQDLLNWADSVLEKEQIEALRNGYSRMNRGLPYDTLCRYYLAVSGPEDPRYNDLLRGFVVSGHPSFDGLLWPALFTRCEKEYGMQDYTIFLKAMLQTLSTDFFPQQVVVAGHMSMKGGYQLLASRQHLRLASSEHATPREAGQYLLFDTARPVRSGEDLQKGLGSIYR
jgi:hypothetical protein